jgi:DNA-directed RNA polymerase beta' subunit
MEKFDSWKEYGGASEGSGRSKKIWLINPIDNSIGLFKFIKSEYTTENFSEKLASEIASIIGLKSAKVKIGTYHNDKGSLSYNILENDIETDKKIIEGIRLINNYYPEYNNYSLYDESIKEYYSLEMIKKAIDKYSMFDKILKMQIFDFLIGNTDRHHSNWAIIENGTSYSFCPLYDNGSSLCCYLKEEKLDCYLGNDKQRFMAQVKSKSTSRIRINKKRKKEPSHFEVIKYIKKNYNEDVIEFVEIIITELSEEKIVEIIELYGEGVISKKREKVITKFLIEKIKILKDVFDIVAKGGNNV